MRLTAPGGARNPHVSPIHSGSCAPAVAASHPLATLFRGSFDAARWDGADALAELERINPLGQVPTLVWPDGTVQTESLAILIETGLRFPESMLLPADPPARAQALRWLAFLSANVYAAYSPRDFPERWIGDPVPQEALVAGATRRIQHAWAVMESQFVPRGRFAFGDDPGALDIAIAVMSRWSPRRAWFDAACPRLALLASAADQHEALQATWADNFD